MAPDRFTLPPLICNNSYHRKQLVFSHLHKFTKKPVLVHVSPINYFFKQGFFEKFGLFHVGGFNGEHIRKFAGEAGVIGAVAQAAAKVGSITNFVAAAGVIDGIQLEMVGDVEAGYRVISNRKAVWQCRLTAPTPKRIVNVWNNYLLRTYNFK